MQSVMAVGDTKGAASDDDTIKVATKKEPKDKPNVGIKLKKTAPKHVKPGNWRDGSVIDDDRRKGTDTPSTSSVPPSPGPVVNQLDEKTKETFPTGRPLEDIPELHKCKHCNKTLTKAAAKTHVLTCIKAKKEKAQRKKEAKEARERERRALDGGNKKDDDGDTRMASDDDDEEASPEKKGPGGIKSAKKSAGKKVEIDDSKKGKKRKADGDAEKGPKLKKKKEELKPKATKPKGPVDVERQCGVLIREGVLCARSLTCKSHSMGAKRAVAGRTLPYDMLLAAYQKKNQAKQQKAALDANAPLEDEEAANGPVDSDEELTAVMHGLSNWAPQPVVPQLVQMPIEREYQKKRLYEQLHHATNGFTVNICKVVGYGAQKLPPGHPGLLDGEGDADGDLDNAMGMGSGIQGGVSRRASAFTLSLPASRRASVVSQR